MKFYEPEDSSEHWRTGERIRSWGSCSWCVVSIAVRQVAAALDPRRRPSWIERLIEAAKTIGERRNV